MGQLLGLIFGELTAALGSAREVSREKLATVMRDIAQRIESGELDLDDAIAKAKSSQAKMDSTRASLPE